MSSIYIIKMKSLAMLNFKNISPSADFYSKLDILNKNILYITHMEDKILKLLNKLVVEQGLQKQVDDFYGDESEPNTPPLEDKEPD